VCTTPKQLVNYLYSTVAHHVVCIITVVPRSMDTDGMNVQREFCVLYLISYDMHNVYRNYERMKLKHRQLS